MNLVSFIPSLLYSTMCRNSRRWTQERLASVVGITQGLLSEIENDKVSPRWDTMTEIAKQLEIPITKGNKPSG